MAAGGVSCFARGFHVHTSTYTPELHAFSTSKVRNAALVAICLWAATGRRACGLRDAADNGSPTIVQTRLPLAAPRRALTAPPRSAGTKWPVETGKRHHDAFSKVPSPNKLPSDVNHVSLRRAEAFRVAIAAMSGMPSAHLCASSARQPSCSAGNSCIMHDAALITRQGPRLQLRQCA